MSVEQTLEQAAQAHEEARREFAAADAELAELEPAYTAARARRWRAKEKVEQVEKGMAAVKTADALRRALEAAGIEYDGPLMIVSRGYRPSHHWLVAVGPQGTGLYRYTPEHSGRNFGREHTVRVEQAQAHGASKPRATTLTTWEAAGMWAWQERGRGQFGAGSGPLKPLAPPEGGKWKWLKVTEQRELSGATA